MLRAVGRRWWVVAVVLALTAGLSAQTITAFPPTYVVEGDYLLTRAQDGGRDAEGIASPSALAAVVKSRGFGDQPPAPFDQMPYAVTPVEGSSVIALTTGWSTRDAAEQGIDRLLATVDEVVQDLVETDETARGSTVTMLGRNVTSATTGGAETGDDVDLATTFTASATVLVETAVTPQTRYEPSNFTASVLTSLVAAPRNVNNYLERTEIDEFSITTDARRAAPILTVLISGTSRDAVLEAFSDVESEMEETLGDLQAVQVERGATATVAQPLARPDGPTLIENNVRRPLAVVVLLGLFVGLGAALSVDAVLARRQSGGRRDRTDKTRP